MKKRLLSILLMIALLVPTLCCFPAEANADQVQTHTPIYVGYSDVDYGAELILQQIHTDGLTDREKIRAVYYWMIQNCKRAGTAGANYDTLYYNSYLYSSEISAYGSKMQSEFASGEAVRRSELASDLYPGEMTTSDITLDSNYMVAYEARAMLTYRIGDCQNFSSLLAVLLGHLGFDCRVIGGDYINSDGTYAMHKWNCVLVDGEYYWLDVRMDHYFYTTFGKMYDKFFMITDKTNWLSRHSWDERYSDWLFANAATVQSYVQPHTHTWNDGVLTTPMTATQNGVVTYTCTGCGESCTVTLPAGGSPFVDVQDSSTYYYDPVLWGVENGIVYGMSDFTFGPDLGCTRAQMVTFLWRLAGEPGHTITSCSFTDVTPNDWFYDAVLWGVENHIIYGITETEFRPGAAVTRCQAVTFIHRLAGEPAATGDTAVTFKDVAADDYFYDAVAWGVENGVVYGRSEAVFDPYTQVIRRDAVTFLQRCADTRS